MITIPRAGGTAWDRSFLVGETLHEFLCLGCKAGFSPLEDLAYYWQRAVEELTYGLGPDEIDEKQAEMLRTYREELHLSPWVNVGERLRELERCKKRVIEFRGILRPLWGT